MNEKMRIGYGYDIHRLKKGRKLVLGGEVIPFDRGLTGHSDADVLLHAVTDALLGAAALGDIGSHFPDTDPVYRDADSRGLLRKVVKLVYGKGFIVGNVDVTLVAERPKLQEYIPKIRANIASDLNLSVDMVSVKATTSEKIGMIGREEGMSARAVCLIYPLPE